MLFAAAASAAGTPVGDADIEAMWTVTASLVTAAAAKLLRAARLAQPASKSLSDTVAQIEMTAPTPAGENERQAHVVSR